MTPSLGACFGGAGFSLPIRAKLGPFFLRASTSGNRFHFVGATTPRALLQSLPPTTTKPTPPAIHRPLAHPQKPRHLDLRQALLQHLHRPDPQHFLRVLGKRARVGVTVSHTIIIPKPEPLDARGDMRPSGLFPLVGALPAVILSA